MGPPPASTSPKVRVSTLAIRAWTREIAKDVARSARNASFSIGLRKLKVRGSKKGRKLDAKGTERIVKDALLNPHQTRRLTQRVSSVKPKVTYKVLRRTSGTVLTVSSSQFKIRLFKGLRLVKTYGVAVGQPAYPTPTWTYRIVNKQVNPTWSVPNSPWAGELQGTTVAGGSSANPLKARWMGIVNGVGIHGTGAGVLDRLPRLARLHPHARRRRDQPVQPRAGRHPDPHRLIAACPAAIARAR